MEYLLLIVGFGLLVKGADVFVTGAGSIAKKFNISDLIIGLTVVAFGTSAPELAVSTVASINGQNAIAISNVVGSNIFNILVVLGVCAIMVPISVDSKILKREFPFAIVSTVILLVMVADKFMRINDVNVISRFDGIILLVIFISFMASIIKSSSGEQPEELVEEFEKTKIKEIPVFSSILMTIFGLVAVVFGGDLVVKQSTTIAESFGVSETLIGLTIVAMGTSLPELVTSIIACRKGNSDMALGNVIGSNIFNIIFILGVCSTISPITVETISVYDIIISTILTVIALFMSKTKNTISRLEGVSMILIFIVYTGYIFVR